VRHINHKAPHYPISFPAPMLLSPRQLTQHLQHPILKHSQPTLLKKKVTDQVTHPHKTRGKIAVLYI